MPVTALSVQTRIKTEGRLVTRADQALPATTTRTDWAISGTVELLSLVYTVGTVIQTQADNLTINWTPTGGSAIALSVATNITAVAAGGKITLQPLTDAGAVQSLSLTLVGGAANNLARSPFVLGPGVISITTSATNTGTLSGALRYRPYASNGRVAAA